MNISNTTWDVLIINGNGSWHADLTFYAGGTTKYDEYVPAGCSHKTITLRYIIVPAVETILKPHRFVSCKLTNSINVHTA